MTWWLAISIVFGPSALFMLALYLSEHPGIWSQVWPEIRAGITMGIPIAIWLVMK